jgi:hypothetical protein
MKANTVVCIGYFLVCVALLLYTIGRGDDAGCNKPIVQELFLFRV